MRIAVVDFGGYAFIAQLARAMARRDHDVLYCCFRDFQGPKGALGKQAHNPKRLKIVAATLGEEFHRYNFIKRRGQERRLGRLFADHVGDFEADVVIGANMTIDIHETLLKSLSRSRIAYVYWLQDIISLAMSKVLGQMYGPAGKAIACYYAWREARLLRNCDEVVAIMADYLEILSRALLDRDRCHVIPNWAPLDDLPEMSKDNAWAREQGLVDKKVLLYSGSMGLKHNPKPIISTAEALRGDPDNVIVVVAEGKGAELLAQAKHERSLTNVRLLPYQPIERLPEVLASADVLTAFVDTDASAFCVPSKLLSYFCAGRACLLAITGENAAAKIVRDNALGFVASPDDNAAYTDAALKLLGDERLRAALGKNARAYAEKAFDIDRITDSFLQVFQSAYDRRHGVNLAHLVPNPMT